MRVDSSGDRIFALARYEIQGILEPHPEETTSIKSMFSLLISFQEVAWLTGTILKLLSIIIN